MDNIRIISALVSCRTRHTADTEYLRAFALITLTFAPGSAPPVLKCRSLFSTAGFPYGVSAVLPDLGYGCPFRGKSRSFPPALPICQTGNGGYRIPGRYHICVLLAAPLLICPVYCSLSKTLPHGDMAAAHDPTSGRLL